MGNKLSCSCAPLIRKAYRYEDSPWQTARRRDGHLLRLWAEVFHVSSSGSGTVKWQQVSEDLVPVNITCIQDSPECVFHITAYNSQVDKILDVRLVQPGTRIGQASECFVYWKDPVTNDTWGLNFTSPIDAKQFRECCAMATLIGASYIESPSFKFSRKASSSYSLKLEPPRQKVKAKRKPVSTPASPSRSREPQCTCMTAEQYARLRAQDPRYRASATLPRTQTRTSDGDQLRDKVSGAPSNQSVYDNVAGTMKRSGVDAYATMRQPRERSAQDSAKTAQQIGTQTIAQQTQTIHHGTQVQQQQLQHQLPQVQQQHQQVQTQQQAGTQTAMTNGELMSHRQDARGLRGRKEMSSKSVDYSEMDTVREMDRAKRSKSKSTDDMTEAKGDMSSLSLDSNTLKRMLKPMPSTESPVTSPDVPRRRYGGRTIGVGGGGMDGFMSEPETRQASRFASSRSAHEIGRPGGGTFRQAFERGLYLDFERDREGSPPSDQALFDNQCYATTPSSSNGNSDPERQPSPVATPNSPTSRLLLEYEMHLRNTLAKGMDAESYSLHTFEALLTQSMENLVAAAAAQGHAGSGMTGRSPNRTMIGKQSESLEAESSTEVDHVDGIESAQGHRSNPESLTLTHHADHWASPILRQNSGGSSKSSTLPMLHRNGRSFSQERNGYYSDRHELARESFRTSRDREKDKDRGYLSDHNSRSSLLYDRQDSLRSGYLSDRESRYGSMVQQASLESADSRLCYLTSSEISDDERMSLTTAVSDEDEAESVHNSPFRGKQSDAAAASFNCTGAVRKAGPYPGALHWEATRNYLLSRMTKSERFLSVKKWLLRKKHQIELARKRGWKGYWVCLKGTTLLFYPCESREGRSVEAAPKHLIIVDGAILQPIPEHPKRDYIFCLSTAFGDAYLFQAPCQVELENWVNSIHCACAAAFARHRGKTGTLHLLQEEIYRLEKAIESDSKLKHMADLQLSVVSDLETKQQIGAQIAQWEENLERLHCEQFRLRCYMASLQNGELPNPKSLLTHVSRPTKGTLNRLGVFTVSSFHAFVCARSPSLLNNLLAGRGATKRRAPMLSRSNSSSSRRSLAMGSRDESDKSVKVNLPDNQQTVYVSLKDAMSVEEFLVSACGKKGLNPMEHFIRVKKRRDMEDSNYFVPHRTDLIDTYLHTHEVVEVCVKILYQVELQRTTLDQMWGFSVEAELIENAERQDELCCYVSRVEDKSVAMQNGIIKGDEIMVINGAIVSDLDMMYIESVLQEELSLCMMMRSSRTEPPEVGSGLLRATDDLIESLVCPPPPTDALISEEMITGLIVPAPSWKYNGGRKWATMPGSVSTEMRYNAPVVPKDLHSPELETSPAPSAGGTGKTSRTSSFEIENLLKTAEQVTGFCRSPSEPRRGSSSPTGSVASTHSASATPGRQLTDAEKLRKVLLELVDTERTYVKHLTSLLEHYLEPLKRETFLSNAEINALFGNIQEIVAFQRLFLQNLEEALELEPNFAKFEYSNQFKNVLFSVGNAFLYYVDHFKLYSSFCASHSKAQKVLHPSEGNQALQEFLAARNPKQQHSSTLESYLIKPIQRILKYPLLLQQLKNLTDVSSDEHQHLVEALQGMEKVAEHINEMQRIHEEYGAIFDHLFRQHQKACKQVQQVYFGTEMLGSRIRAAFQILPIDLSPGDLLYYGGVEWLNIADFLGKIKKGLELHAMCFVFKTAVVFLCKERLRQKKKLMGGSSKSAASEVEIIRYQVLIPVTEVQVRTSSARDADSHFLWELIHLKSQLQRRSEKVYVLSNSTSEFRNNFLRTIRQIIRESVRNMNLPSAKSGAKGSSGPGNGGGGNGNGNDRGGAGGHSGGDRGGDAGGAGAGGAIGSGSGGPQIVQGSQTLGRGKKQGRSSQRHSAGNIDYDNVDGEGEEGRFRTRSKTVSDGMDEMSVASRADSDRGKDSDPGTKSEGEEECGTQGRKPLLGRTPNHLSLSTTSTLSAGSTGSQAKLIQSSSHPEKYQPQPSADLGSPVWKPRDVGVLNEGSASGAARPGAKSEREHFLVCDAYGGSVYMTPPCVKKEASSSQSQQQPSTEPPQVPPPPPPQPGANQPQSKQSH